MKQFRRQPDGTITATFAARERGLLTRLATELDDILDGRGEQPPTAPRDPALAWLLPDAYTDDPEAAAEFRRFTEGELVERKQRNAGVIVSSLDNATRGVVRLDEAQAQAWLRSLTDLRLTFAARLGIKEDGDERRLGIAMFPLRQLFSWLGFVQESLVHAIEQ